MQTTPAVYPKLLLTVIVAFALVFSACTTQTGSATSAPATATAAPAPVNPAPMAAIAAPVPPNPTPIASATTQVAVMASANPVPTAPGSSVDFETQIKPFLSENCFRCHGGSTRISAGINLTTQSGLKVATADNLMYEVMTSKGSDHMPPRGNEQPSAEELAMIKLWIKEGAKTSVSYPRG